MSVKSNFSLHRTYIIFRSLGLRHLTITSVDGGQVVGMITRRDLMGFNLEEKLDKAPQNIGRFGAVAKTVKAFGRIKKQNHNSNTPRSRNVNINDAGKVTHNPVSGPSGLSDRQQHEGRADPSAIRLEPVDDVDEEVVSAANIAVHPRPLNGHSEGISPQNIAESAMPIKSNTSNNAVDTTDCFLLDLQPPSTSSDHPQ